MISKTTGAMLLTAFVFLTSQSANVFAQATTVCFNSEISRIGATGAVPETENSGLRFEARGGTCNLPNTPFFLIKDIGKEGLAILLTAFALNKTVTMVLPSPVSANSLVFKVHIDG